MAKHHVMHSEEQVGSPIKPDKGQFPQDAASSQQKPPSVEPADDQLSEEGTLSASTFTEWRAMMGAGYGPFLAKIIEQFINDASKCVEHVREAIQQGDAQAFTKAAHGLKGISGNVGAVRLQRAAEELEQTGYAGQLPETDVVLILLEQEFGRAQKALESERLQVSG